MSQTGSSGFFSGWRQDPPIRKYRMTSQIEYYYTPAGDIRHRRGFPFTIKYSLVGVTVIGIGGAGIFSHFGSDSGLVYIKFLALFMLMFAGLGTVTLLMRYRSAIHGPRAMLALLLLSVLPYLRIFMEVVPSGGSRQIVDGLVLIGPYYLLPFSSLGIVAYLASTEVPFDTVLRRALPRLSLIVIPLALGGFLTLHYANPVGVYSVYNNLFIPAVLLLFFPSKRQNILIGTAAFVAMLVMTILQASRAYLLVILYLGTFIFIFAPYSRRIKSFWIALLTLSVLISAPVAAQFLYSDGNGVSLAGKLDFDTLTNALSELWQTGNFLAVFFWEGNSRARILLDAFSDFTGWDYVVGRGITATYSSFIERSTIEIGWMQELFRLGLVIVIPTFFYAFSALLSLALHRGWQNNTFRAALIGIGLTRILDGFIYGLPDLSLYTTFFWMLIMQFALKENYRRSLFRTAKVGVR